MRNLGDFAFRQRHHRVASVSIGHPVDGRRSQTSVYLGCAAVPREIPASSKARESTWYDCVAAASAS